MIKTETNGRNFIAWDLIDADPEQPRKAFDKDKLQELANSFGDGPEGIHTDLLVREHPEAKGRFMLVAGERRWRAAELRDFDRVPCRIAGAEEIANARLIQLTENMQRANMTALEEAAGAQKLLEERRQQAGEQKKQYTVEDLGRELGKSRAATYELLSLLKLSKAAHAALVKGEILPSHAVRVAALPLDAAQLDCLDWVRSSSEYGPMPSVRDLQAYIESNHCKTLEGAPFPLDKVFEGKRIVAFSCLDCPHRSGNQPDWPDGKNKNTCLRPECYRAKALAQAVTEGKQVIEPKRFDQDRGSYVLPEERVYTHGKGYIEAKKVINPKAKPQTYVTTDSVGDLLEVWLRKDWQASAESDGVVVDKPKAAKAAPAKTPAPLPKSATPEEKAQAKKERLKELAAEQKRIEQRRLQEAKEKREREERAAAEQLREKVVAEVLPTLREKLAKVPEKVALIYALADRGVKHETHQVLAERKLKSLEKCDAGELRSILCEVTWRMSFGQSLTTGSGYADELVSACKIAGIDLKAEEKRLAPKSEELPLGLGKATAKKKGGKKK